MTCPFYSYKSGIIFGDYWCDVDKKSVNEDIYHRYCRNYDYDSCPIYKRNTTSTTCYLTTIVCDILNMDDNNEVLNNLRSFRDEVMQKDSKYYDLLRDYDNIGPQLADRLLINPEKEVLAKGLYDTVIKPVSEDISNNDYEKAVTKYEVMTLSLINYFGLKHEYNADRKNNYMQTNFYPEYAGHGVRILK